jgi:hypothetical protein
VHDEGRGADEVPPHGVVAVLRLRNTPRHLRLMQIVTLGETIMKKILVVAAFTASIGVSSFAFAQGGGVRARAGQVPLAPPECLTKPLAVT